MPNFGGRLARRWLRGQGRREKRVAATRGHVEGGIAPNAAAELMASGCKTLVRLLPPPSAVPAYGACSSRSVKLPVRPARATGEATPETRIMSDWFERLVGFRERDANDVRALITAEGTDLVAPALNQRYKAGAFTTPFLGELKNQLKTDLRKPPTFSNVMGTRAPCTASSRARRSRSRPNSTA